MTIASIALMLWAALEPAVARKADAMIAIILVSFLALIGAAFTIYVWRRRPSDGIPDPVLPPPRFAGLFDRSDVAPAAAEPVRTIQSERQRLLELASTGDLNALADAHSTTDASLYADVLSAMVEWASERQENIAALVSHISKSNKLRANKQLAQRLIETWKAAPDRRSTIEMMHIAALSDDAETYAQALEAALESWRGGKLPQFSGQELADLFVSQYWIIAPHARRGGVGFALKRRLSGVRRELATTMSVR